MNWYYKILGGHTHVRVFMNGGKCGDLVFRNEEFTAIRQAHDWNQPVMLASKQMTSPVPIITFFNESE